MAFAGPGMLGPDSPYCAVFHMQLAQASGSMAPVTFGGGVYTLLVHVITHSSLCCEGGVNWISGQWPLVYSLSSH